ncbi:outer membrane protein assembly factor BamB family protein [Streptosporangium sp. H16]|uniref:outer membrane protein assembly factor BamB family protein n=1 Tax=Streptosporangium sp. H16 TaxID=3444184 RepID=UPI003F7A27D2
MSPPRHRLRSALALAVIAAALLAVPAGAPASRPRTVEPSPIAGIRVSKKDGIVSARVSGTGRVLWKSAWEGDSPDAFDVLVEKFGKSMNVGEDRGEGEPNTASTGRHLVIETTSGSGNPHRPDDRRRITVIDALTGLRTWSVLSGYAGDGPARPFFHLVGAAAGKVLVEVPALRTIRALDPRDGTVVWETALPGDCVSASLPRAGENVVRSYSLADERLAVAMGRCEDRHTTLTGLDPATGRVRWRHRLPPPGDPELVLDEGVSFVTFPGAITVVDGSGLVLADALVHYPPSRMVTDEAVILSGDGPGDLAGVRSISRSSGRVVWSRPEVSGEVGVAAGKIYVRSGGVNPWLGDGLTVLEPADGRTLVTLSAPLTEEDIEAALAAPPGWGERGGVPATAWPDPCALLPPAELVSRAGTGRYAATPIPAPPEMRLTTPLSCELTPARGGTPVTVTVVCAYASAGKAAKGMEELPSEGEAPDVAEHAGYFDAAEDAVILREGRVIVTVEAFGDRALLRHAGRIVSGRLREPDPAGKGNP